MDTKKFTGLIILISLLIPALVTALFMFGGQAEDASKFKFLPLTYATTNGISALVLIAALIAIKNGKVLLHKRLMQVAIGLGIFFLAAYLTYHYGAVRTDYPKDAPYRSFYLILLLLHIVLSVVTVPLVLFSYVNALAQRFDKHRKIAKFAWPIWFFVTLSGVVIYLMISPHYPK